MDEIQYGQTVAAQEEYEHWLEQQSELARQQMQAKRIEQDRQYLLRHMEKK